MGVNQRENVNHWKNQVFLTFSGIYFTWWEFTLSSAEREQPLPVPAIPPL